MGSIARKTSALDIAGLVVAIRGDDRVGKSSATGQAWGQDGLNHALVRVPMWLDLADAAENIGSVEISAPV